MNQAPSFGNSSPQDVSPNNKGEDIEYFFEKRAEIAQELNDVVASSNLTEQQKEFFFSKIRGFVDEITKEATSPARSSRGTYDIYRGFVISIITNDTEPEMKEVFEALRDTFVDKFRKPKIGY